MATITTVINEIFYNIVDAFAMLLKAMQSPLGAAVVFFIFIYKIWKYI